METTAVGALGADREVAPDERAMEQAQKEREEYVRLAEHHATECERFERMARSKTAELAELQASTPQKPLVYEPAASPAFAESRR